MVGAIYQLYLDDGGGGLRPSFQYKLPPIQPPPFYSTTGHMYARGFNGRKDGRIEWVNVVKERVEKREESE